MNDDLDLLIELYLSGSAAEADVRRLEELLRRDPQAMRTFAQAIDEDVALRKFLSFDRQAEAAVTAGDGDSRLFSRRVPVARASQGAPNLWAPLLAGATLFMALVLWVSVSEPKPAAHARRPAPVGEDEAARRARSRLAEIERERQTIVETHPGPGEKPDPDRDEVQRRRLTQLDQETRRIEKDLEAAAQWARRPEAPADQPLEPLPAARPPVPAATEMTRPESPAVLVDRLEGTVYVVGSAGRTAAIAAHRLASGQGLETTGVRSAASLVFPDGTRIDVGGDTAIRDLADSAGSKGKRLTLSQGSLSARVVRQPGAPMVIATPQGEARVVGTWFRLAVDGGVTRLEVSEGRVQLRRADGRSVEVNGGHFALAGSGVDPAPRPLPIEDIVLLPDQARVSGVEWKLVKDSTAASGVALEALDTAYKLRKSGDTLIYDSLKNRTAFVLFTFMADAGRDYHVWIRGRSMAVADRKFHDEVAIEPVNGQLSQKCRQLGWTGDNAFCYTGYCLYPAYGWIGGYGEDGTSDAVPLTIRFARPGQQTLKLYAIETPMRIDAIWLSSTQGARPAADQRPPLREGK